MARGTCFFLPFPSTCTDASDQNPSRFQLRKNLMLQRFGGPSPSAKRAFCAPCASPGPKGLPPGSHHLPRWLWGLLRPARLPQSRQHPELSSVLAARAQGQENAGYGCRRGKSDTPDCDSAVTRVRLSAKKRLRLLFHRYPQPCQQSSRVCNASAVRRRVLLETVEDLR